MPKEKATVGESKYDRDVRCGYRERDPMVVEAWRRSNAAAAVAVMAVALALVGWILALS